MMETESLRAAIDGQIIPPHNSLITVLITLGLVWIMLVVADKVKKQRKENEWRRRV